MMDCAVVSGEGMTFHYRAWRLNLSTAKCNLSLTCVAIRSPLSNWLEGLESALEYRPVSERP
jgi:hypothetical protein